jgi:hypothetical protein
MIGVAPIYAICFAGCVRNTLVLSASLPLCCMRSTAALLQLQLRQGHPTLAQRSSESGVIAQPLQTRSGLMLCTHSPTASSDTSKFSTRAAYQALHVLLYNRICLTLLAAGIATTIIMTPGERIKCLLQIQNASAAPAKCPPPPTAHFLYRCHLSSCVLQILRSCRLRQANLP